LEDREFLFELFARTMRGVVEQTWGWNDGWQRAEFARRFRRYTVSVVESDARPVGGLFLEHGPDAIFIHEIQLLPEWQGRGIGTAIVRAVCEQATARGVPVELSVVPANHRAQRLYERLGFEVFAIESPFIRMRRGPSIARAV
jgi:ribosomal protein S18 acetylase RimI-like enzyme